MTDFQEEKADQKIEILRRKEEEESAKNIARVYGASWIDLAAFPVETDALILLSEQESRQGEMAVFQIAGKKIKVAVRNPENETAKTLLKKLSDKAFISELFIASPSGLRRAWTLYQKVYAAGQEISGNIQVSQEKIELLQKEITGFAEIRSRIGAAASGRITEALEIILGGALAVDASDVHIEPQEGQVRLRFRLDGVLSDVASIAPRLFALLLSRIKLVSELKLNIHDKAQDGRFTIRTASADIEVRVSTLPGPNGENVVMRILNPKSIRTGFADLGMQPWVAAAIEKELAKPNGMILTTGPTGSGKTTTLYTFLQKIHSPAIKIITIEDPIEYHLKGIEQTQVDAEKGYDFANGLRAIVRQDPDVILVGEIRDLETAETAMHASLTGHLVFSTLHTNNAAGTIPRLIDLGVKSSIIAPAINVSMGQRLVRKLCSSCKMPAALTPEEKEEWKKKLAGFPKNIPIPEESSWTVFKANPNGCAQCNFLGYKGRTGIYEIILVDENVEKLVLREPSEYEITEEAKRQGQITMLQDGFLKILHGVTDTEEVERVAGS